MSEERARANVPLESFFDLVYVLAFTEVTRFLYLHLTWTGLLQGLALLAALWWAWVNYSWLTDNLPAHEFVPARVLILAATAAMLVAALAVQGAFTDSAILFAGAYFVVRMLHVALYVLAGRELPGPRQAIRRLAPGFIGASLLLVIAGIVDGQLRFALWAAALAIDYGVPIVRGISGLEVHARHFTERHGLVIILALGESIVAFGGAERRLDEGVLLAAVVAVLLNASLWWAYFDDAAIDVARRLAEAPAPARALLARDAYSYIHFLMVAGIIFLALGLRATLADMRRPLGAIQAFALCGGVAVYLAGLAAFHLRATRTVWKSRLVAIVLACAIMPAATRVPAIVTLASLAAVMICLLAFEVWGPRARSLGAATVEWLTRASRKRPVARQPSHS